jgi:hypothetical protein
VNFNDYDVIVLAGAPDIGTPYTSRLSSAVSRGRALFITYGPNTDINNFNRYWWDASGVRYLEPVKRNFTRAGFYSFESLDPDHPVFSVFNFEDNKPPEVKFYTLPKLSVDPEARTLMQFTGGQPALVERTFGRGKVLTFTGPMSPNYSDLVSHGFFVPLISRIAEYLASDLTSLDVDLRTGQSITRAVTTSSGAPIYAVELIGPDSSVVSIPPEEQSGSLVVRTHPLDKAGIYSIVSRSREIDRFAVNLPPAESDLTAADPEQFATALGAPDFDAVAYRADIAETIAGFRVGRELWQLFLWIAVALMALEMLLGRRLPSEE